MGSTIPFLLSLLFTAHLKGAPEAQPISPSELADFKDLLEHFENKLELPEREGLEQDPNLANEEQLGDAAEPFSTWDGEYPRPQSKGSIRHANWQSPERAPAAVRNKLGGLFSAPRRFSNCFGRRLDRIGSVSGLGCNRSHVSCNLEKLAMSVKLLGENHCHSLSYAAQGRLCLEACKSGFPKVINIDPQGLSKGLINDGKSIGANSSFGVSVEPQASPLS